jgi:quinol monooxygenase YgiN
MIASTSTLKIQSGKAGEFETLVAAVTTKVRANEPGNVLYQLTKSRADDNTYRFLELYRIRTRSRVTARRNITKR